MILTCPKCSTRYTVAADQMPAEGRNVRCVKCGHLWHQMPVSEESPEAAEAVPAPEFAAAEPMAVSPEDMPDRSALYEKIMLWGGWAGLAVIVLLLLWAGYAFRHVVIKSWPQSSSVYRGLGLVEKAGGLQISVDPLSREVKDGHTVLLISGKVKNAGKTEVTVPLLRAHLLDSTNAELARWSVRTQGLTLKPGESTRFATRFHNPPEAARHFEIRFAAAD